MISRIDQALRKNGPDSTEFTFLLLFHDSPCENSSTMKRKFARTISDKT